MKWRLSRSAVLVLGIAQVWGQIKLVLTLWIGGTSLAPLTQWVIGSALALGITLVCYQTTNWAVNRWGKT